jgi:hypothetical protein
MKKILFVLLICVISVPAFAVTNNVSIEGQLGVVGITEIGVGNAAPSVMLKVNGNITLGTAETGTLVASKELVLMEVGDVYGPSILRLRNRNGENGAIYESTDATTTLIDFIFKTAAASGQRNIRLEARAAAKTGQPSFHIGGGTGAVASPDTPSLSVGDTYSAFSNKLSIGSYTLSNATLYAYNNSATEEPLVQIEQAGTGDTAIRFNLSAATAQNAAIGLDLNDNKNIKISNTTALTGTTYADSNTMMRIHTETGSQGITDINHQSRARAYRNTSTQALANATWVKVQLNGESYDEKSEFDSTTNFRFTALKDGYYQVNANVLVANTGATSSFYVQSSIYVNGVAYSNGMRGTLRITNASSHVSDVIPLTAGQYIELYVYQNSGGALTITNGATETYMSVHKIS